MSTHLHEPTTRPHWRNTPLSRLPRHTADGGKVGGVIAGVSRAYGFDPRTTRLAYAIATLVLPVLFSVYLALWVLLPRTAAEAQTIDQLVRDRRRFPLYMVIAVIVVAGGVGSIGSWFFFRDMPWGVILIGLGVLLWWSTSERANLSRPVGHPADPAHTVATASRGSASGTDFPPVPGAGTLLWDPPVVTTDPITQPVPLTPRDTQEIPVQTGGPLPTPSSPVPAGPPPTRRNRVPITSIGAGVAVLWFGFTAIGKSLDWFHIDNLWVVVSGLAIVLVAMLASIVVNRSWVLPILFLPLMFVLVALCVTQPDIDGASGQRTERPATLEEAVTRHHLATGQLTLDLTDVPLDGSPITIEAEVGLGRLHVVVPDDVNLTLLLDAGAGQMELDGNEISSGWRQQDTRTVTADGTPAGTMVLDLRVGMGQIDVDRVAA